MSSTEKQLTNPHGAGHVEAGSSSIGLDSLTSSESACLRGGNVKDTHSLGCEAGTLAGASGQTSAVAGDGNRNLHPNNNRNTCAGRTNSTSLSKTKTASSKVDIVDELYKFYKELEQIDPEEDLSLSDDIVDTCVIGPKQKPSLASDQEVKPPPDQQNEAHNRGQSHRPDSHTGHSRPPLKKCSYDLSPSNAADKKHRNIQGPPLQNVQLPPPCTDEKLRHIQGPHLQNVPPPPPPPCTYDNRPRYDLRDSEQDCPWLENGPINSYVHNEYGGGGGGNCDGQLPRGHQNRFVPNRFHPFRMEPPVYVDPYDQQASSSDWSYSDEHHQHHWQGQPHPSPSPYSDSLSLILMRGAPGSGKSTMARELLSSGPSGLILSTDDYFLQEDRYNYDPRLLSDAHCWNQSRTLKALCEYHSPVIIDNTNMQAWEMKPYVQMALHKGYSVCFQEPNTAWKYEPSELERRNKHGVPKEKIAKMLERFELPMTVDIVLRSMEPSRQRTDHASRGQRKRRMDMDDFQ